jgi:Tfp pilus assembly protein PilO
MAGALEDFSRRPLQYKVMVFAGIGALLGLLYWQFMLQPLRKERDAAAADLEGQKSEANRLKAQKKAYDELVAKEAQLKEDVEQNQKALPTESEIPAFLDMLSRKTSEAGVEMLKRDVRKDVIIEPVTDVPGAAPNPAAAGGAGATPTVAPSSFVKVPVDVEVVGTYYQLKKFFSSLRPRRTDSSAPKTPGQTEEKDRIVTIESLTLSDPKVKNNEIVLTARFVASTFRAKAQDPVPGAPPAPPPAAAPAPAPAGGATPPAGAAPATGTGGTAAKPDSMKAKTENAMDQSDIRTRKAAESDGEPLPRENTSAPPRGVP